MADIENNVNAVRRRIESAATRAGRDPAEIILVAVSKTFPAESILAAHSLGLQNFGENRVEEAAEKIPLVRKGISGQPPAAAAGITWHLIGHLQSRKVRDAVPIFDMIHSIDSVALARRVSERASILTKTIPILLEVNVSGEASKYGFAAEPRSAFHASVQEILDLSNLDVQGLMTVAPIVARADDARPFFKLLRRLRDELRDRFPEHDWPHLSMGMTDDLEAAVAEGATIVRIGRAIFGERE